ncbi:Hypothetical_protein [Hexamita inflata]|uniref:Hypothetical_protein n=1 Tax=Hexamita inflata TaxID=28002 RepID=A0AA86TP41_9EUKA|nr:Hypothetical protein HINF_LOCUS11553 [Hexamita inflata]CAI9924369.1 Hypothetical protein HINF_LOCUS12014 [Hexamita inflata]CAI9925533.1 Hypothetical protein HINF_LOCUS13178 [Hexamita inflata]
METFMPPITSNFEFYNKFRENMRAPKLYNKCKKCQSPIVLVKNCSNMLKQSMQEISQLVGRNTDRKVQKLVMGSSLQSYTRMCLQQYCQSCISQKDLDVPERTVDDVFNQFRLYCQRFLDNLHFYDGEAKEIDEFVAAHCKYHRGEPTRGVTTWYFSIRGSDSKLFRCFHILGRSIEDVQPYINKILQNR